MPLPSDSGNALVTVIGTLACNPSPVGLGGEDVAGITTGQGEGEGAAGVGVGVRVGVGAGSGAGADVFVIAGVGVGVGAAAGCGVGDGVVVGVVGVGVGWAEASAGWGVGCVFGVMIGLDVDAAVADEGAAAFLGGALGEGFGAGGFWAAVVACFRGFEAREVAGAVTGVGVALMTVGTSEMLGFAGAPFWY